MPLYEYVCRRCFHPFEELSSHTDVASCPKCAATDAESVPLSRVAVGKGRTETAASACGRGCPFSHSRSALRADVYGAGLVPAFSSASRSVRSTSSACVAPTLRTISPSARRASLAVMRPFSNSTQMMHTNKV